MKTTIPGYVRFVWRGVRLATDGDWRYYAWIGGLFAICLLGLNAYARQLAEGLIATDMSDQVSWGVYIANFTFLVGVAAAAVMIVIPTYIYRNEDLHDLVVLGELLAIAAIVMCLCFVTVDLGRPDRFWHLIPGMGRLNFPASMLSWDVIVLNGYLALNVYVCFYLLYCRYRKKMPAKWHYLPIVFLSIVWAISIHTVTAFLYVGLGGRHFWNSSIIGPRFIASAFTAGPALIILALQIIRRVTASPVAAKGVGSAGDEVVLNSRSVSAADFEALVRRLPELAAVPDADREQCISEATIIDLVKGDVLLQQGTVETDAFFVLTGCVEIKREEGGRSRLVGVVGPGEQIGELSALERTPRKATAVALEDTCVMRLRAESLRQLMRTPEVDHLVRHRMNDRLRITDRSLFTLRSIVQVSMLINVFLLLNEIFKEFYTWNPHVSSSEYLYFGLHGYNGLVPWIWTAVACNFVAMVLLLLPLSRSLKWLDVACVLAIVGIWIEKGMGLVVPGFIPSPLGEIVEYTPGLNETLICFGIWAFGLLCYTLMLRVAVPILQGSFTRETEEAAGSSVAVS